MLLRKKIMKNSIYLVYFMLNRLLRTPTSSNYFFFPLELRIIWVLDRSPGFQLLISEMFVDLRENKYLRELTRHVLIISSILRSAKGKPVSQ